MGDLEGKLMNTLGLCYDLCTYSPRFSEDDVCSFHQILQEAKLKESSVRRGGPQGKSRSYTDPCPHFNQAKGESQVALPKRTLRNDRNVLYVRCPKIVAISHVWLLGI